MSAFINKVKGISLFTLVLCLGTLDNGWTQDNVFSIHGGMVLAEEEGVYLDDPIDTWLDRETSYLLGGHYYRKISSTSLIGLYGELETLNTQIDEAGTRIGLGLAYLSRVPENLPGGVGFELGGYLGAGFVSLPEGLDSQIGADFGIFLGPVIQLMPAFKIAAHLVANYGWYGGGDRPEGVQNIQPRVRFGFYFEL